MSLTVAEVTTLKTTWKQVSMIGMEELGLVILNRLFTDYPETQNYFQGMGLDDVKPTIENMRKSKRVAFHGKSVAASISEILDAVGTEGGPQKVFKKLASIHHRKKVEARNFDLMGKVLLRVIASSLNADESDDIIELWKRAYGLIKDGILKDQ